MIWTEGFSNPFKYESLGNSISVVRMPDAYASKICKGYLFDFNWASWILLHITSNNIMRLKIPLV